MSVYFFTESEYFLLVFLWKNFYQSFWKIAKMMIDHFWVRLGIQK